MKAFLIAAPTSGCGKTMVSRNVMAALRQKGYAVQPFKCGPDYIDTKFHEQVCGRPSINLDTFMATDEHVQRLFARYSEGAGVAVIEGMMGMFDGYDRDRGSSAAIARVLGVPVVLVVDARSAAYSMAALLQGFLHFRSDVHVAGVVFNKVGSPRHAAMLQRVCDDLHVECFGFVPRLPELEQASRYLGLDFSRPPGIMPGSEATDCFSQIADRILARLPLQAVGHCRKETCSGSTPSQERHDGTTPSSGRRVLTARNGEAFSFLYQETIDRLGSVTFFDPETDALLPDDTDLLYLPGGYPEKHLEALVRAEATRRAVRDYARRGGRIVAECGGMMYLCEKIVTDDGEYPMCGVLPYTITARKADRKQSLGYRRFVLDGKEYRGHEFHYTQFLGAAPKSAVQVYNAQGEPVDTPVFTYKNVLASYTHLYDITR